MYAFCCWKLSRWLGDSGVCSCTVARGWLRALIICCMHFESPVQTSSCTGLYCLPNSCIPSYSLIHELMLFLEIHCGSTIYLTYFHCPHVRKHSLKALYYLIFTLFHSTFLQFLTGIYLQNRVQEVLLTSTCSDWFQKDGAGLALQTFLDLIRRGCGEEIAALTFFCFPLVLAAVVWDTLFCVCSQA